MPHKIIVQLDMDNSTTMTFYVDRNGDLLSECWLEIFLPPTQNGGNNASYVNWRNNTGHGLIEQIELKIGGRHQLINKVDTF